ELRQGSLGDHLERLAGRVRQQVKVKAGHVDKRRHKPREARADKLAGRFNTRCESSRRRVVDSRTARSTVWGQWGKAPLDAQPCGFAPRSPLFSAGKIGQGPAVPIIHRANKQPKPLESLLFYWMGASFHPM